MKKKTKKLKKKVSKRIPKIRFRNPNTKDEQDALDIFFQELHRSKRIEQEGKYQNQSVIDICASLIKNLNDDMYYENVVDCMQDINNLLVNLNKALGI